MKRETRYTLQGQVKAATKTDLASLDLVVLAFAEGQPVARSAVNAKGGYKLAFEWGDEPPSLELRVTPARMAHRAQRGLVFTKTLSPHRFVGRRHSALIYEGIYDLRVPGEYLVYLGKITKSYHLHGVVYAATYVDIMGTPTLMAVESLPGARLEFYEVDSPPSSYRSARRWPSASRAWAMPTATPWAPTSSVSISPTATRRTGRSFW